MHHNRAAVRHFIRYLESKRSVDDRALNLRVWNRLSEELPRRKGGLRIADIGAGIGTGIERMLDWGLLSNLDFTCVAVERDPELAEVLGRLESRIPGVSHAESLEALASSSGSTRFDLVVAHAFLDIVALEPSLSLLVALLRPDGLLYLPITFDGVSVFEPSHPDDEDVLGRYHRSMDETGSSTTGRRLFHALRKHPVEILEAGSSDWIVYPRRRGYPDDEAFFLRSIVETIEKEVGDEAWAAERYRQIDAGELVYVAHQLDVLARRSASARKGDGEILER